MGVRSCERARVWCACVRVCGGGWGGGVWEGERDLGAGGCEGKREEVHHERREGNRIGREWREAREEAGTPGREGGGMVAEEEEKRR